MSASHLTALADAIDAAVRATPPKPDRYMLAARILKARDPSALAEVEAGFAEAARGDGELVAWLARPLPRPPEPIDPLDAATRALDTASAWVMQLPPTHPKAAQFLTLIGTLAKTAEKIGSSRPSIPTTDEVTSRINGCRDEAVRKILEYTGEAHAKLKSDRVALVAWADANLGPMISTELARRLDAMLGETPAS